MDSFEAEAKRSWFTLRDTLRATIRRGRLWVPAVVTPVEDRIRVFTSEGAQDFRPRRLRWIAADSFVLTGVGKDAKIRRSYLRFKSPEEALRGGTIIRQNSAILEEPLVPVEEFPVQVRLLMTGRYAILQFYTLFWRIVVGLFIILVLESFGLFGLGIGVLLAVAYIGFPIWTAFVKARKTTQGWIRVQGRSIVVRTGIDWTPNVSENNRMEEFHGHRSQRPN